MPTTRSCCRRSSITIRFRARRRTTRRRASGRFPARSSGCRTASPAARVTLDQIEQTILAGFHDPRVYLRARPRRGRQRPAAQRSVHAGAPRGAARRSRPPSASTRAQCISIDRESGKVHVSSIFSWREKEFAAAYADKAPPAFASRSPIERAILAFVMPKLLTTEKEFLEKNTLPGRLHAVRLDAERPDRPRRTLTSRPHGPRARPDKVAIVTGSSRARAGQRHARSSRKGAASPSARAAKPALADGGEQLRTLPGGAERVLAGAGRSLHRRGRRRRRDRANGRDLRRPRHPRQQRRPRQGQPTSSTPPTPSGRRRSTRRCFRPFARRGWPCRTCAGAAAARS